MNSINLTLCCAETKLFVYQHTNSFGLGLLTQNFVLLDLEGSTSEHKCQISTVKHSLKQDGKASCNYV